MVKEQAYLKAGKTRKSAMLDDFCKGAGYCRRRLPVQTLHLGANWFLPSQKLLRGVRTGSHITKVYDTAQTPCARMLARKDVAEETKKRLLATRAALDITSLLHEIFLCQDQLDEIARRRQPLVIKKRGSYASIAGEFTT
ncbi:hypothetical protein [Candidatus Cryosericum septentrionale]|uniref:Uncharacterized protein n=1 Tax=Candidatus Cryosericum septentrionale TaxID=2290913 RepID=A0A398DTT7_9BACT|nr:hypothetical protein [Candidatus Cryosericum septentrionale]RIE15578.1 hypothetical protein SMC1_09910 [Candidatus Cryosericum septentrionale]